MEYEADLVGRLVDLHFQRLRSCRVDEDTDPARRQLEYNRFRAVCETQAPKHQCLVQPLVRLIDVNVPIELGVERLALSPVTTIAGPQHRADRLVELQYTIAVSQPIEPVTDKCRGLPDPGRKTLAGRQHQPLQMTSFGLDHRRSQTNRLARQSTSYQERARRVRWNIHRYRRVAAVLDPANRLFQVLSSRVQAGASVVSKPVVSAVCHRRFSPLLVLQIPVTKMMNHAGRADRQSRRIVTATDQKEDAAEDKHHQGQHTQHHAVVPFTLPVGKPTGKQHGHVDQADQIDQRPVATRTSHAPQRAEQRRIIDRTVRVEAVHGHRRGGRVAFHRCRPCRKRGGYLVDTKPMPDHST